MQSIRLRLTAGLVALSLSVPAPVLGQTEKALPQSQEEIQLSFAPLVKQTAGAVVNVAPLVISTQAPAGVASTAVKPQVSSPKYSVAMARVVAPAKAARYLVVRVNGPAGKAKVKIKLVGAKGYHRA